MKKKRILLLWACCLMISSAWAGSVTLQQAKNVAGNFMAKHVKNAGALRLSHQASCKTSTAGTDKASYYVFNSERANGGFVIVSGDDRAPAVLGYSDRGSFVKGEVPLALQQMLDSYAEQIDLLDEVEAYKSSGASREPIAPMVTAEWGQQAPYNTKLPIVGSGHAMAGIGTVAMTEVMKYHNWPARPSKVIPSYTTSTLGITLNSLPVIDFQWDLIKDCYMKTDTTSMSAGAVATLMRYVAQAQQPDFKVNSTWTSISAIPQVMSTYFGYKPTVHIISRLNYSTSEWEDMIYNELAEQRPVIYGGTKDSNTYTVVCDGYDGQGLFHINWGMNGQYNGYFCLNVLNFDLLGTGSTSWPSGFVSSQLAVVGIEPGSGATGVREFTSAEVVLNKYVCTRASFSQYFQAWVSGRFYNYTSESLTLDFGWGLYQGDVMLVNIKGGGAYTTVNPGSYVNHSNRALQFGFNIGDGTYTIRQMYSERNAHDWHLCVGADKNYLEVVIRGDSCFMTPHGNASPIDVTVNNVTAQGNMHPKRPVNITLNLTNNGESLHSYLYMRVNGSKLGTGIVSAEQGTSTDVSFRYMPTAAGDYVLSFSFNEDGSNPIATDTLHIQAMPTAKLTATAQPLNVTDVVGKIITDDKFSLLLAVTNTASTPYGEDISVGLYKRYDDQSNIQLHAINRYVELEPGQTDTLLFELDGVVDGWQYYAKAFYYSNGNQVALCSTDMYTIHLLAQQEEMWAVATNIVPEEGGVLSIEGGVTDGSAVAGNTVVFTVAPNEGYDLDQVLVISEEGDTIAITHEGNIYRFTMPTSNVTINVSFLYRYIVNLTNKFSAGGVTKVNYDVAHEGDEITITASPNVGWHLQDLAVLCGEDTLSVIGVEDDAFSFIMPAADVTVSATFVRSVAGRFELVTDPNDITSDGIYMIANNRFDRAMKYHGENERTFCGTEPGEWIDEDKTLLLVDDNVCLFTIDDIRTESTLVNGESLTYIVADLNTGNGYLTANGNYVLLIDDVSRCHAYMSMVDSTFNCKIRFAESVSQAPTSAVLGYNQSMDQFYTSQKNNLEPIWFYRLVDAHAVSIAPTEHGTVTLTSETLEDGTVQRGCEVNFIVQPDEDYCLKDLTVLTATRDSIAVVLDEDSGVYSFVMPGSDVTISATFENPGSPEFERGDVNGDTHVNMDDLAVLIHFLLTNNLEEIFFLGADCSLDGNVTMDDLALLINYLLSQTW